MEPEEEVKNAANAGVEITNTVEMNTVGEEPVRAPRVFDEGLDFAVEGSQQ